MANKDPNEPISNIEEEDEEEDSKAQGDQARRLTPSEACAQAIQAQEDQAKWAVKGSGIGHPLTHVMAANNQMAREMLLPNWFAKREQVSSSQKEILVSSNLPESKHWTLQN